MRLRKNAPIIALAALIVAALVAFFLTRDRDAQTVRAVPTALQRQAQVVDDGLSQTARSLSALADTAAEQDLEREALRLADHELDAAFSTALRQAAAAPPPKNDKLQQLTTRIARLKTRMRAYAPRIAQLAKQAETDDAVAGELAILKAQSALDQDELDDAQQDLAREGGDRHAVLENMLQQHEAAEHQAAPQFKPPSNTDATTLLQQARLWMELQGRAAQIATAREQAAQHAAELLGAHRKLEAQGAQLIPSGSNGGNVTQAALAQLQRLSDYRKTLAEYDKRIQDSQQLAEVYGRWAGAIAARRQSMLHRLLGSVTLMLAILLAVALINRGIGRAFRKTDRRRLQQLRAVSKLAVQVTGVLFVLLVLFGVPTQITTLIGLATAGLTVALKDFIVGFFGWFVLLGRNGLHIGDWVEIEGVSGEVIEIGLLKTVLLEVGSLSTTGHPTGRRVSFVNSFAIEGHFFNFSTAGQWFWDELQVMLPAHVDPYKTAEEIAEIAGRETENEARLAEQDWQRVTAQYGVREFSAKPAVSLRPGPAGMEAVLRYITRAPLRYQVKSRLLQLIVSRLQQRAGAASD